MTMHIIVKANKKLNHTVIKKQVSKDYGFYINILVHTQGYSAQTRKHIQSVNTTQR